MLTVVMYHYVRDFSTSRFPRIKGLDKAAFIGQLDYIGRHYVPVTVEEVVAAWRGEADLPPRAALLTFDDGLIDHYEVAMPLLAERRWQGSFFPIAEVVALGKVSAVHKIHHVLAAVEDPVRIYAELIEMLGARGGEALAELKQRFLVGNTVGDPPEVNFVKRVLQKGLPEAERAVLVDTLFQRHVTGDEAGFAQELYMGTAELRALLAAGMRLGNHGLTHRWLADLSPSEVRHEIREANRFLLGLGVPGDMLTISYPYGNTNGMVQAIAAEEGCVLGVSTRFDLASPDDSILALPRLDTNHLPHSAEAEPCDWTTRVAA